MKTLAIVVLYNPDDEINIRVNKISYQVDSVIIYDNSDDELVIAKNRSIMSEISNANYYSDGINHGIGDALNFGAKYALENMYDYYLTFDQDTAIPDNYVVALIEAFESQKKIGVIGPIYKDINANRECRFPVKSGGIVVRKTLSDKKEIVDVMSIISSGSLYDVHVFEKIGFFKNEYFIDYIDNEFCLRLIKYNYRVCVAPHIVINHALGNRTKKNFILKFSPTNYPFYRKYYITRNRLFVYKDYIKSFPTFVLYDLLALFLDLFRVIVFEHDKKIKLKSYLKGIKDFYNGTTGRLK